MSLENVNCATCPFQLNQKICRNPEGKGPDFCPTLKGQALKERCLEEYAKPEIYEFARHASRQEAEGYAHREEGYAKVSPLKPRILEVKEFAQKMNFQHLGLAFCIGLRREAKAVEKFYSGHGFKVTSVVCKVGQVPKEKIGIKDDEKIAIGQYETMCNPILQALVLNDAGTDLNILLGLCVGHDSLLLKYSEALCTVLAVKDRLLGHNPMAAVYNIDSYYRALK